MAFHTDKSKNLVESFEKIGVKESVIRERFTTEMLNSSEVFNDTIKAILAHGLVLKERSRSASPGVRL